MLVQVVEVVSDELCRLGEAEVVTRIPAVFTAAVLVLVLHGCGHVTVSHQSTRILWHHYRVPILVGLTCITLVGNPGSVEQDSTKKSTVVKSIGIFSFVQQQ